jgi:hypothetical protein
VRLKNEPALGEYLPQRRLELISAASDLLDGCCRETFRRACGDARGRHGRPPISTLEELASALDPPIVRELREYAHEDTALLRRLLAGLASGSPPRAHFVFSSESWRGDAVKEGEDRFLTLLGGLLTRTRDILTELGGIHYVQIYCLGRHVLEPSLPNKRAPLHARHIRSLLTDIDAAPGPVKFEVTPVCAWADATRDLCLVLADILAHGSRQPFGKGGNLASLERRVTNSLGVPLRVGPSARPAVAVGPSLAAWASEALTHADASSHFRMLVERSPTSPRVWAVETTQIWLDREVARDN